MNYLMYLYLCYRRGKLLQWVNTKIHLSEDPMIRFQLLKLRKRILQFDKVTLPIIKGIESRLLRIE